MDDMVKITENEKRVFEKGGAVEGDTLSRMDRAIVGKEARRLHIPFDNPAKMQEYFDIAIGMFNRCQAYYKLDVSARTYMMMCQDEMAGAQRQINDLHKGGMKKIYMAVDNQPDQE